MAQLKHIGRIKNTGRRCVVVFREIYNEQGHVVDSDNCLIVETDSLPDAEHQDIMRIVESEPAQSSSEVYDVLARERLGSGMPALQWMAKSNRLRKFPTSNIELTPDSNTVLGLDKLNKIVKMQKAGSSEEDIRKVLQDDTDNPPRNIDDLTESRKNPEPVADTQTGEGDLLDDATLAQQRLDQAKTFEREAKQLREQAYELDPSLDKRKKKKTAEDNQEPAKQ